MVLEALAAVGLAGNIVQFLDFSCKLFSTAASIQRSHGGASEGLQDVETVTLELQRWCVKIPGLLKAPGQQQVPQRHKSLSKLAEDCETAATELLTAVQSLKAKKPKSKWSCFKAALATTWKESQINEMETRLDSFRQALIMELALLQSDDNKDLRLLLENLGNISRHMETEITSQILKLGVEIRDALETLKKDLENSLSKASETTSSQDHEGYSKSESASVPHKVHAANLADCSSKGSNIMTSLAVLESLTFERMHYRYDTVLESHAETFEWVFTSKFQSWLKSPDTIFWISGKPGSGKSTMMKKLVDHPKTRTALQEWSGSHKLVIVDYFFWVKGTNIQRSQEGLLRALLYDILRQTPNLINYLLPLAWKSATDQVIGGTLTNRNRLSPEWSRRSLLEAFERLSTVQDDTTKFCIFVDGLDEYDGDHEELIQTVRHLTKAGIKLCVASRPWNVFEESFGSDNARKIYMQYLNTTDIHKYVHDKLMSHRNFQRIDQDSRVEISNEIVEKSRGVFLWVRLVVRSLNEGLINSDSITLLRKRLKEFPSDLDEFFGHMFSSLEAVYRSRLSHMFQVTLAARSPLSPIAYWYLDQIEETPDLALTMPMKTTPADELSQITDEITSRINGRSKGLLEVTRAGDCLSSTVDFLHRTVRDFFMTTDIQKIFADWQHSKFDPDLAICKILLAEFKLTVPSQRSADLGPCIAQDILISASIYESKTNLSPIQYLDEIEKAIITCATAKSEELNVEFWEFNFHATSFLSTVALHDIAIYFSHRIESDNLGMQNVAEEYLIFVLNWSNAWYIRRLQLRDSNGIPKLLDIILPALSRIQIKNLPNVLDGLVFRSGRYNSDARLSLIERFIKHSLIDSSILEDPSFKKCLRLSREDENLEDSLRTIYDRYWRRNETGSSLKGSSIQADPAVAKSKSKKGKKRNKKGKKSQKSG